MIVFDFLMHVYCTHTYIVYDVYNRLSKHAFVSNIHGSPEKPPFMSVSSINTTLVNYNNT